MRDFFGNRLRLRILFQEIIASGTKQGDYNSASVSFSTQNLFTISAKALKGQDPSQAGFAKPNLSVRPNYTIGLNVSF